MVPTYLWPSNTVTSSVQYQHRPETHAEGENRRTRPGTGLLITVRFKIIKYAPYEGGNEAQNLETVEKKLVSLPFR
jgi:hypothetical protein